MHRIAAFTAMCLCVLIFAPEALAGSIAYSKRRVQGVPVHVVTVDLNNRNIKVSPAIARHGIGSSEGFGSMVSRLQPSAAITGTYFCVRTLIPVGDIVIDGSAVSLGCVGTAVCFTHDNSVEFKSLRALRATGWAGYASVISTGPRLVVNGLAYADPWAEGFRDGGLYRKANRTALGLTRKNKLLLVTVNRPIYLSRLAKIMRDLGAYNAVNLDGGSSTALYYKGRVPSHPGRRLTNLLVVYESPVKFARIKPQLAPAPVIASKSSRS